MRARLEPDGSIVEILPGGATRPIPPRADWSFVDATNETDIARHARQDANEAMHDATAWAREVRRRKNHTSAYVLPMGTEDEEPSEKRISQLAIPNVENSLDIGQPLKVTGSGEILQILALALPRKLERARLGRS
jgi:hypothetical protein